MAQKWSYGSIMFFFCIFIQEIKTNAIYFMFIFFIKKRHKCSYNLNSSEVLLRGKNTLLSWQLPRKPYLPYSRKISLPRTWQIPQFHGTLLHKQPISRIAFSNIYTALQWNRNYSVFSSTFFRRFLRIIQMFSRICIFYKSIIFWASKFNWSQ
jgi:hypothetical protein